MASSAACAAAGGKRTTKVQRCGGSGVAESGPASGASPRGLALTAPSALTISPPREVSAARAASSVGKRSRGRPIFTWSRSETSMPIVSRSSSVTVSPLVSASVSGAPAWRSASACASASGAKKCVAATWVAK